MARPERPERLGVKDTLKSKIEPLKLSSMVNRLREQNHQVEFHVDTSTYGGQLLARGIDSFELPLDLLMYTEEEMFLYRILLTADYSNFLIKTKIVSEVKV